MKTSLEYMREYHERAERTVECDVCSTVFKTYYQQKKTCSKECSAVLREKTKRKGQPERLARWRSNPENVKKMNEATRERQRKMDRTEYRKRYYAENKERLKEVGKAWYKKDPTKKKAINHKRRMKDVSIKGDHLAMEKRLRMFDECCYCGSQHKLTIEHLVPVSRGGTNTPQNLYVACKRCNSSKNAKPFLAWYRKQSFYDYRREFNILLNNFAG